jgi:hypothetical protein
LTQRSCCPRPQQFQPCRRRLGGQPAVVGQSSLVGNAITPQNGIDPRRSAKSAAAATELGDFFQYQIEHPVTLGRQKSSLLPIVNQEVEAKRVSIYNEATHAKFPLLGLRFKNTTGLHLMQGPITVFDNNSYAGDARILDLQPKEERLISYAIDLGVEVEPVVHEARDRIIRVKIVKGVLEATVKTRASKTYTIKNRTKHDRTVLAEHSYRADFKLVTPEKAEERARDVYRFTVPVAAGKTGKHDVVEEKEQFVQVALANLDDQRVRLADANAVTSLQVKAALAEARVLKKELTATQADIAQKEKRLKDINDDQTRLRANLKEVPPTSEAYKRYVKKFDAQESEIERRQEAIKNLQEQGHKQQKGYDKFLEELSVE